MFGPSLQQRWYRRRELVSRRVPASVLSWLFDPASLTARLKGQCSEGFRVELLSQCSARPRLDEAHALGISTNQHALIRQVRLCCGDRGWVYARTVIPFSTLTGAQRVYANLGTRPLGAMLFADRTMTRDEVMVTVLSEKELPSVLGLSDGSEVWGRRSVFRVGSKPLLVSEYFLPRLLEDTA